MQGFAPSFLFSISIIEDATPPLPLIPQKIACRPGKAEGEIPLLVNFSAGGRATMPCMRRCTKMVLGAHSWFSKDNFIKHQHDFPILVFFFGKAFFGKIYEAFLFSLPLICKAARTVLWAAPNFSGFEMLSAACLGPISNLLPFMLSPLRRKNMGEGK